MADEVNAAKAVCTRVAGLSPSNGSDLKTFLGNSVDDLKGSILSRQYSLRGSNDMAARYSGKVLHQ